MVTTDDVAGFGIHSTTLFFFFKLLAYTCTSIKLFTLKQDAVSVSTEALDRLLAPVLS